MDKGEIGAFTATFAAFQGDKTSAHPYHSHGFRNQVPDPTRPRATGQKENLKAVNHEEHEVHEGWCFTTDTQRLKSRVRLMRRL